MTEQTLFRQLRSVQKAATAVRWLGYVSAAAATIGLVVDALGLRFFNSIQDNTFDSSEALLSQAEFIDRYTMLVGVIEIILIIAFFIAWLVWVFKSNKLARSAGADQMKYSSRWAVAWYFIPIMNLFNPYFTMKEIYFASKDLSSYSLQNHENTNDRNSLNSIKIWWLVFLFNGFISKAAFRITLKAEEIPDLIFATKFSMFSELTSFTMVACSLLALRTISEVQSASAGRGFGIAL